MRRCQPGPQSANPYANSRGEVQEEKAELVAFDVKSIREIGGWIPIIYG
jgi:hypothetical protein